ncbi:ribonuclease III [Trametes meyenii]|nr:ribonuclease III [Trametes meyenii]
MENEDFTVGAYTVALHSSNTNEWPSVVYNDIVVVAANMLLDSLADGNVKLSQAHMIVISDAQRVMPMQIPHPIMRMMTDFYAKILQPPRVLAMVTSAPDRWASLDLTPLEISFRARSFFLATKAADAWFGPLELVLEYDPYRPAVSDDTISTRLRDADPEGLLLRPREIRRGRRVLYQLGRFASDLFWRSVLTELTISATTASETNTTLLKSQTAIRQRLVELRGTLPEETLKVSQSSPVCNVTPKLAKLVEALSIYDGHGASFRAIVVVKDRAVARVLVQILQMAQLGLPFIRAAEVRHGAMNDADYQKQLYRSFDKGQFNLLVLTKPAQDLELPPASVIISYDIFEDQLSYTYFHTRSKGRHSHLLHLVEQGNNEQRRILAHVETVGADLRGWIAGFVKGDSHALQPASMYTGLDPCLSDSDDEDNDDGTYKEFILDPTTSARLYKSDAEAAIHRFVTSFQQQTPWAQESTTVSLERYTGGSPEGDPQGSYRYTIVLPRSTGIPDVIGPYCATKAQARREAFFRACQECAQRGLMDYHHFPQPKWRTSEYTSQAGEGEVPKEIQTANTSSATHGYPRKSPDFWANSQSYSTTVLYPTVIIPDNLAGQPHAPVVLLTRAPMPLISDFLIFFSGARATVRFYKGAPFEVKPAQLQALRGYTARVVRALVNKPFDAPSDSLLCFFAPLSAGWQPLPGTQGVQWSQLPITEHIPWDAVQLAADYFGVPLYSDLASLDDNARDAIVQDRNVEFTMRHFLVKVRHDLTPLSKAEDSPREAEYPSFLEYCKARRKDFPGLEDEKQPMVEVVAVPGVINNLHPMSTPPTPPAKAPLKYLIPELTYKFTIPASTFRTLWLLPSIMTRIDSYLLVKELDAKLFHLSIHEQQLLIALSTRAAWTESNYERLEFLGDAFLKVVASNYLYVTLPTAGEGVLHYERQGIIGNKTLHECAMRVGVCPYIQHKRFVAKLWQPPTAQPPSANAIDEDTEMADAEKNAAKGRGAGGQKKSKKQRQLDSQNTLWMGDKVVADVVEANLAAAFLSGGHEVALQAARRLQIPLPNVAQWTDFARMGALQQPPAAAAAPNVAALQPHTLEAVQAVVGSTFSKPELLAQALTHGSAFGSAELASYERLEFIGDAILDFLVARHIFERHPHLSPGGLTLLKGAMVSNRALAAVCVHLDLHRHLNAASEQLAGTIRRYVEQLGELRAREYDAAARENRLPGQYWLEMPMEPPKCLSDVVESVIGALYVCDGFFEVGVGRFFDAVFKPFMDAHVRLQTLSANPKVTLLELLQAEGCQRHAVVKKPHERQNMPIEMEVRVHDHVIAEATDSSATIATRKVSLAALDVLANDPELLARLCDCRPGDGKKPAPKPEPTVRDAEEEEAAEVEEAMDAMVNDGEAE